MQGGFSKLMVEDVVVKGSRMFVERGSLDCLCRRCD